eukprot:TRINITY_DN91983_c0_g1_i1.p1 TRINITY_DN91983_c0_g1~~TRINITY_DN91983_c0_g1_i1.p1  ORF type:complete len:392 (+),score=77.83 TRINITY_DN91983_c0_g1_i1:105-1280(+)
MTEGAVPSGTELSFEMTWSPRWLSSMRKQLPIFMYKHGLTDDDWEMRITMSSGKVLPSTSAPQELRKQAFPLKISFTVKPGFEDRAARVMKETEGRKRRPKKRLTDDTKERKAQARHVRPRQQTLPDNIKKPADPKQKGVKNVDPTSTSSSCFPNLLSKGLLDDDVGDLIDDDVGELLDDDDGERLDDDTTLDDSNVQAEDPSLAETMSQASESTTAPSSRGATPQELPPMRRPETQPRWLAEPAQIKAELDALAMEARRFLTAQGFAPDVGLLGISGCSTSRQLSRVLSGVYVPLPRTRLALPCYKKFQKVPMSNRFAFAEVYLFQVTTAQGFQWKVTDQLSKRASNVMATSPESKSTGCPSSVCGLWTVYDLAESMAWKDNRFVVSVIG